MAQTEAPSQPQRDFQFVDDVGRLTQYGISFLTSLWRQVNDGRTIIPCAAGMAANVITLTPDLSDEGASTYADCLTFAALMLSTSTGNVTAKVASGTKTLDTVKVLKSDGAAQAAAGDVVSGNLYLFVYHSSLDGGAGAFVLK